MKQRSCNTAAYITGGSSGIGLAIARRLRISGADLVLIARDPQRLAAARQELLALEAAPAANRADARPPTVETVVLDVTDPQQVAHTLATAVERFGAPDILVNSAGMAHPGYFEQLDYSTLEETLRVNLHGAWHMIQALLPYLRQRRGQIVNVASFSGLMGTFGYTAYAASKFALVGMSEALRSELQADGVTVAVLCPADTDTPQLHAENKLKPPEAAELAGRVRVLEPDQVARECLKGLRHRKFIIIPGWRPRMVYLFKRLAPVLLYRLMDSVVRRYRRRARLQRV
ncbi:MAG: SDR family NAD(P)-dependent oxidoreductase [Spirochaetaceae bacterium]|nr:MAG: SDR family NAD(P)-dependent oxidoreductase [Spirochaetaceae bacterium]